MQGGVQRMPPHDTERRRTIPQPSALSLERHVATPPAAANEAQSKNFGEQLDQIALPCICVGDE